MANDLQDVRRSAVVTTFGPGAVADFRAGGGAVSGVVAGLDEWDRSFGPPGLQNHQKITETRLQKKLGVRGFRLPPIPRETFGDEEPDRRRLIAVRFPDWLQCPSCDRIAQTRDWQDEPGKAFRFCATCTAKAPGKKRVFAIPVRFVMACERGHLSDFPWHFWVQHKSGCTNSRGALILKSERPGLAGLILRCPKCSASRSMDGVFSRKTWEGMLKCSGDRPWLPAGPETCQETPLGIQRGASNLYFPAIQTALSIPPWDDYLQEVLGSYWDTLVNVDKAQRLTFITILSQNDLKAALAELNMSPETLCEIIERRVTSYEEIDTQDLRPAEYRQLLEGCGEDRTGDVEFEARRESVPAEIASVISSVVRVVRLREVRALTGFTRIVPPGPDATFIAPLSLDRKDWLPAIEVRGEGIFLTLREAGVAAWEKLPLVQARVEQINAALARSWAERAGDSDDPPPAVTARYMLCHTFAHVVMKQLVLECGYSGASLQERIYASEDKLNPMAGLLIYTSTPDADGTLGGLQRQGKSERLAGVVRRAVQGAQWCSSDPLCISDVMGASASHSKSVCHSCCYAPETSCEAFNQYLDRGLLVGTEDDPQTGFFRDLLE